MPERPVGERAFKSDVVTHPAGLGRLMFHYRLALRLVVLIKQGVFEKSVPRRPFQMLSHKNSRNARYNKITNSNNGTNHAGSLYESSPP